MTLKSFELAQANILIVDDRPDNLFVLETVLKDSPEYNVVSATSGQEAIEHVKNMDFALILLDIQMPVMDGFQTAAKIKSMDRGRDIPIIMVTAIYKEDPHVLKGYSVGAIDYVGKPFNPDILKAKVGVYANLYLKSRQLKIQNQFLHDAQNLISQERNIRSVLETLPVGVLVADNSGKIYEINRQATEIWGGTKNFELDDYSACIGWWFESGNAIKAQEWAWSRAIESGETSQNEVITIQCFDGSKKIILNSASPLRDIQGKIIGAIDVIQDITNEKWVKAEQEKQKSSSLDSIGDPGTT